MRKLLYSLKQVGHQWKAKLDEAMQDLGFAKSGADDCLYALTGHSGTAKTLVLVYVDDMVVVAEWESDVEHFKEGLGKKFKISDLGPLKHILGIQVTCDRSNQRIRLDQYAYVSNLMAKYGMEGCSPALTPMAFGQTLSKVQSPLMPDDAQ